MPSTSLRPGDLVRIRAERWRVSRCLTCADSTLVDVVGCDAGNRTVRAQFLLPAEPIDRIDRSTTAPRTVRPAEWRLIARRALGDATPAWTSLRAAATASLDVVPFQLEPALAFLRGDGCRFLIADAVGLGKTVQAGLMLAELRARQPEARAIVVAPAGLREQWHDELQRRFSLNGHVMDAAGVARAVAMLPVGFNPWLLHPLVITSIDYLKRAEVMRALETVIWDVVVLDESHTLAGHSDRATAAAAVARRGRCLIMLTATPHSGDADAFRRMSELGRQSPDDTLVVFSRTHANAGLTRTRRTTLLRVRPTSAERAMHDALHDYAAMVWRHPSATDGARLAMSVLARRASSSAASLACSVQRRLVLLDAGDLPHDTQLGLPFAVRDDDDEPDAQLAGRGLTDLNEEAARLRQIETLARHAAVDESKLRSIQRLLRRTSEHVIVFTEYRDTLERLASALPDTPTVRLHGGLTARQRAAVLREFTDGSVRVLLATDAASEGLNLHHRCRLVVNLELPWTPLRLEQRIGRVDRIGQRRRVHAMHLVAADTSEELVLARLSDRISRIRAAMGPLACSPLTSDRDVSNVVLGGASLPDPLVAHEPERPSITSLQREALAEATRIATSRALLRRAAVPTGKTRPVATVLRRRKGATNPAFQVFQTRVVDGDGRELSQELLALALSQPLPPGDPAPVSAVALASEHRLTALTRDIQQVTACWIAREQWLANALRRDQARLSAELVQPGLFDRRVERAAVAQAALLEDALARSIEQRAQLLARLNPRVDSCDLLFAVVFA